MFRRCVYETYTVIQQGQGRSDRCAIVLLWERRGVGGWGRGEGAQHMADNLDSQFIIGPTMRKCPRTGCDITSKVDSRNMSL